MKKFFILCAGLLFLDGCSCASSRMEEVVAVRSVDRYLSCKELLYAIEEAKYIINIGQKREASPAVFADSMFCMPATQLDGKKNQYTADDRLKYLENLYRVKNCGISENIKFEKIIQKNGDLKKVNLPIVAQEE